MSTTISLPQLKQKMAACRGCRDNFYNHPESAKIGEGISPTGVCWCLPDAKARYRWAINMQSPTIRENFRRVKVYGCYHGDGPYRDIYMDRLPPHCGNEWADKNFQKQQEQTP